MPLFNALLQQNVEPGYISLLASIYCKQQGQVKGSGTFRIQRGVKQGDVISPMLFNVGLEMAIRRWKAKLGNRGIKIDVGERLTNMRYADDLIIYASSSDDLCIMLELLQNELALIGLHLNSSKTKAFTTENLQQPMFLDISGDLVQVLTGSESHKYLGSEIIGDMRNRSSVEISLRN